MTGKDYTSAGLTLPLHSLVFHDIKRDASAWVRLHPPLKQEAYASVDSTEQLTNLFPADKNDGIALSKALRITDITLHFPEGIKGQCLHEDPANPFADTLTWPSDQTELPELWFRWRPSSWDISTGAWITGRLTLSSEWKDGDVWMRAALALGSPSCIPTDNRSAIMDNRAFTKSLSGNTKITADAFRNVLNYAALWEVEPRVGGEVPAHSVKLDPAVIKQIDDIWNELDKRIKPVEPSLYKELGITYSSFASIRKEKKAQSAAEWVDYLRFYLLAWRIGGENIPARPPANAPVTDDAKAAHKLLEKKWSDAVNKLREDLQPTDKVAFHRWCEEAMIRKDDSAQLAKLWVLLSAYAEDERNEPRSNIIRQTMQPRVSGKLSLAWKDHPEGASVTAVELIQGPGRSVKRNDSGNTEGLAAEAVKPVSDEDTQAAGEAAADAGSAAAGVKPPEPTAALTVEPAKEEEPLK